MRIALADQAAIMLDIRAIQPPPNISGDVGVTALRSVEPTESLESLSHGGTTKALAYYCRQSFCFILRRRAEVITCVEVCLLGFVRTRRSYVFSCDVWKLISSEFFLISMDYSSFSQIV